VRAANGWARGYALARKWKGEPAPDNSPLVPLLTHAGGVVLLAEAIGVGRRTIHRIGTGEVAASPLVRRVLNEYARKHRLRLPFPG
jgi:hypothetical protein